MNGGDPVAIRAAPRTPPRGGLGDALGWLCGGALGLTLLLILSLLALVAVRGVATFWPPALHQLELADGRTLLGEIDSRERRPLQPGEAADELPYRVRVKVANRDLTGADFQWVDESAIVGRSTPREAALLERLEWGNLQGTLVELSEGERLLASGSEAVWRALPGLLEEAQRERRAIRRLEKGQIGDINHAMEQLRLAERRLELGKVAPAEIPGRRRAIEEQMAALEARYQELAEELFARRRALLGETLVVETADGTRTELPVGQVVRALRPNALTLPGKVAVYVSRVVEFVAGEPRESNTEGGIFPAIFGTVMMVFLMTFLVTPLGVLAALYLREYARQGLVVRLVRIAVNNLAGVPSIVFGVFGLGFFVYFLGGSLDRLFFPEALPTPTFGTGGIFWAALTLALLTVPVVIVATEEGLAAVPRVVREGSLALGATKWETTWRVVLPAASPGILTGIILAMARAAGEVAPLMIVGMVKLAPALPVDHHFPFVHLERKFMHLGFHIFDVGFQSPNVEATTPLVFSTALLLLLVVTAMNLTAIVVRERLRRRLRTSGV